MNVKDMSTDDIETRIGEIIGDMANIRAQIGEAKGRAAVNGEYSDSGWFQRANLALRLKGRDHQALLIELGALLIELGKRRREEKKAHSDTVDRAFIDVARSRLDYATFRALMDEATALAG